MSGDPWFFLSKLAAGVPNESSSEGSESKGSKPDFGKKDEGRFGKKPFPSKGNGNKNGNGNESKNGNGGKKEDSNDGDEQGNDENGQKQNEGKPSFKSNGEQEIPGNESAETGETQGTAAIDPKAIFDFFAQNPTPNDETFHEFSESNGFNVHEAESIAYALAGRFVQFLRGGKSQGLDPNSVDPEQLQMGIEVESEHTDDPTTCKKIALDHLAERQDYYSALKQIESGGSAENDQNKKPETEQKKNDKPAAGQQTDVRSEGSIRS